MATLTAQCAAASQNDVPQSSFTPSFAGQISGFAHELAAVARAETMGRWVQGCPAENKAVGDGFDPVTDADREAERAMRALIAARYPDHGIMGEELADRPAESRWSWSLDPVDGTRAFVCGVPVWTTLIAFLEDGVPRFGMIDAPALGENYSGWGDTAILRRDGREAALAVSGCARISEARLSTTDPALFSGGEVEAFERIRSSARMVRYGLDGYAYARLAAGSIDLVVESGLQPHDYNALGLIIRATGGCFGDWRGGNDFAHGRVIAAASERLFDEALAILSRV